MNFVAVDNCVEELTKLVQALQRVWPESDITATSDPLLAVKHVWGHEVDAVFAECDTYPATGVEVLHNLRKLKPQVRVVLVGSANNPASGAAQDRPDGFVLRPVSVEKLKEIQTVLFK